LARALSADRQDDKTLFCVSAVSGAFSSPPDAVIDRGALRNDYETTSTRRGGVQWPDSDGSFALQVGALDRASVRAHVCALSDVALRSAAAARRWTVRCVRGGIYYRLYRIFITRVTRFAAVPVVRERAISVHFLIKVTIKLSEIF
jgi:hypothetical protein